MIVSIVSFSVEPSKLTSFLGWFPPLVDRTRLHAGCLRFDHAADVGDPTRFTLIEVWESAAAHRAHLEHADYREMVADGSESYGMHDLEVWKWSNAAPPTCTRRERV